jgi:hypothetical protein
MQSTQYAIRIPANDSVVRDIEELLTRPVGRRRHNLIVWYKGFLYRQQVGRRHDGWWRRWSSMLGSYSRE